MITLAEFAQRAVGSRLVTNEQVKLCFGRLKPGKATAEGLAGALVRSNHLTTWQARQIAAGRGHLLILENRYRLLDKLGEGGMGAVFLAHDNRLDRQVVLKIPRPKAYTRPRLLARFRREVLANGRLQHPNIVRALDVGLEQNRMFIVLEFVDGEDLYAMVQRTGPLPPALAIDYTIQVALALEHAHQHGVIHRDLKPSNVLVSKDGAVKVLDLGLARFLEPANVQRTPETPITRTGAVIGTVGYMAPEQVEDTQRADARSDLYSLGCTLYHLLSGRPPFNSDNAVQTLMQHMNDNAKPIPGLEPKLQAILSRLLEKDPKRRFRSAASLVMELTRWRSTIGRDRALHVPIPGLGGKPIENGFEPLSSVERIERRRNATITEPPRAEDIPDWLVEGRDNDRLRRSESKEQPIEQGSTSLIRGPLATVAAVLLVVVTVFFLQKGGSSKLIIDWPQSERPGGALSVDQRDVPVPSEGDLVVHGTPGHHRLQLKRPGYKPINVTLDIPWGKTATWTPEWAPTEETARRQQFEALDRAVNQAVSHHTSTADDTTMNSLREAVLTLRRRYVATPESIEAASVLARLPSPLDRLDFVEPVPGAEEEAPRLASLPTSKEARSVAISPDSSMVVTGNADGTITRWDVQTNKAKATVAAHNGPITSVAFSPDGYLLASSGSDGKVVLWDAETGDRLRELLAGAKEGKRLVRFSPDGKRLAVGDAEGQLTFWDTQTGELLQKFRAHAHPIQSLIFSPNGKILISSGKSQNPDKPGEIRLWDLKTGRGYYGIELGSPDVHNLAISPQGGTIAAVDGEGVVRLWRYEDGKSDGVLASFSGSRYAAQTVAFSPDGQTIAAGGIDGRVRIWRNDGSHTFVGEMLLGNDKEPIRQLEFSPEGRYLIAVVGQGSVRVARLNWPPQYSSAAK